MSRLQREPTPVRAVAGFSLAILLAAAVAVWTVAAQRAASPAGRVTAGDTGTCIGMWSQSYNELAQLRAARIAASAGSEDRAVVGITMRRGLCRVAIAASPDPQGAADVFQAAPDHVFRREKSLAQPLRVRDLPAALRRWATRVNDDGTLIGHP